MVDLVRPTARFSHLGPHRAIGADCGGCHPLDAAGDAGLPGHDACADAACHAADFASRAPVTCGACHAAIEPWRALTTDALPKVETEFGASMSHRTHAGRELACTGCHRASDGVRQRRLPRDHQACTGAACHGGSATPALDACESCHQAGLVEARILERLEARWTVRDRFVHASHGDDCESCHRGVWGVATMPPPPEKERCAGCHDGKAAFKMTGHGCKRCHGID
jgi:hypothetical protein